MKKLILLAAIAALSSVLVADTLETKAKMRDAASRLDIGIDEFTDFVNYHHVNFSYDSCQFIPCLVSDTQRSHVTYLIDAEYNGKDFVNMDGVIVLVGHRRFETTWDSTETSRKLFESGAWENKELAPSDFDDTMIVSAICDAPDDTVIKVRLNGSSRQDFVMSPAQRQAWKDVTYYYRNFEYRDPVAEKARVKE